MSIRLTGGRQIDFKVSSLLMPKIFLEVKIQNSEIDRVNFNNKYFPKSKQIFTN